MLESQHHIDRSANFGTLLAVETEKRLLQNHADDLRNPLANKAPHIR